VRRHELDPVSLVAGLLFLVVAVVHISARSTDTDLSARWMVPTVLVLLGVLGLLSAVRSPQRERQVSAEAERATTSVRSDDASTASTASTAATVDDAGTATTVEEGLMEDEVAGPDEADGATEVDETATDR
jgi:hypothetical protein